MKYKVNIQFANNLSWVYRNVQRLFGGVFIICYLWLYGSVVIHAGMNVRQILLFYKSLSELWDSVIVNKTNDMI